MTYPTNSFDSPRRAQLSTWLRRGLDLIFPPHCVGCSRMGTWLCSDCLASVEPIPTPICRKCGQPTPRGHLCAKCRARHIELDGIRSVARHSGVLREAINHFKYQSRRELDATLGMMLFDYWNAADLPTDLVLPVPLHPSRQKERGFNQSALLAGVFAALARLPLDETHLVRTRATAPQVGLVAEQRKTNVRGAFDWTGDPLKGVHVLLIDDVCTTGATLEASAQPLRECGAESVWALTLARPFGGNSSLDQSTSGFS
jgi:ComF family protein